MSFQELSGNGGGGGHHDVNEAHTEMHKRAVGFSERSDGVVRDGAQVREVPHNRPWLGPRREADGAAREEVIEEDAEESRAENQRQGIHGFLAYL